MKGTSITIMRPVDGTPDRFGNVTHTWQTETVGDVLVAPGASNDLEASRPEGVTVAYTLHFPKTYTGSLEGCMVILPAPWSGEFRVVGDPREFMDANTPTRWHLPVEIEAAHG